MTAPSSPSPFDSDGVIMLYPPNPEGASWNLGAKTPAECLPNFDMDGDEGEAHRRTEHAVTFWRSTGHRVTYASGRPPGVTVRLNVKASGGSQTYHWRDGALEHGYIGNERDLKNLEVTVYVRVSKHKATHTSMGWKLRGGKHTGSDAPLASCTGMTIPYGHQEESPRAYREFDHPIYDYVPVASEFPFSLAPKQWLAVKLVSWVTPDRTRKMNRQYLDTNPFDADGKPGNHFRLYSEWIDCNEDPTKHYRQAAVWAGWMNTFRVDGWNAVDFAILSAREIIPPVSGARQRR